MTTYLTYTDDTSAKFWQISIDGNAHTVTFGKIGTAGQSKTKTFDTAEECQADAKKLIKSKKAKGYSEDDTKMATAKKTVQNNTQSKNKQDKTAIFTEFDDIIKNGDLTQVVPFLTAYKNGNVSELKKRLNKARHYYLDWHELKENGRVVGTGVRGTVNQQRILFCFALALLSPSDFNGRWYDNFFQVLFYMSDPDRHKDLDCKNNTTPMIFDIIKQFDFKELFDAFYVELNKQGWNISYDLIKQLESNDLIHHNPQIFARSLAVFSITKYPHTKYQDSLDNYIKDFLDYGIPSRDLKNLFEYETNIGWQYFAGIKDDRLTHQNGEYWLYLIPEFIKQGTLERDWVLQKCLEIQSNLWKQNSKKFYKDLFKVLNPSEQELLNLQDNLFMLLQNELKVTVNFAIDMLKPLIIHKAFNINEFLIFVSPIMMNGEFKGTIKNLLTQFEKLLKDNPKHITLIYPALYNVLFVNELTLQEKAVKLLVKYASQDTLGNEWESLIFQIEALFDSLPNDIKTLLTPIYQTQGTPNEPQTQNITQALLSDTDYHYDPVVRVDYFADDNKIALYSEFNDILFNFGQLEYSVNPLDIEIFMASWLNLKQAGKFHNDSIEQFKDMLKSLKSGYENDIFNMFEIELRNFIFDKNEKYDFRYLFKDFKFLASYQILIKKFIDLTQLDNSLSLLSTPTHLPAFIEPKILVERLIAYQNAHIDIDLTDYAIALARMPRANVKPAIELLSEIKNELIVESLKCAFGLIEITDTVPSIQQMKLMGVEYIQEQMDKFNADIIERENKLANMNNNPNIAKGLLDRAKKAVENTVKAFDGRHKNSDYQAWRGVFATIAKTHYPNIELDYSHEYKKIFDKVTNNELLGTDYHYTPIITYKDDEKKGYGYIKVETGDYYIGFHIKEYFNFAHTSDIYRQSCHYMGNGFIYLCKENIHSSLMAKNLMPLNQIDFDKFLATYLFNDRYEHLEKDATIIIERLMSAYYPYNAYTQFILVACLFAKDKVIRLAGIDAIIFAINHSRLDPDMFAKHSSQWIGHFSAPFSRYVECLAQLSQYDPLYQKVLLQLIEKTIMQLEFKNKLPTNFKKYLEIYYLLLSSLNKKADKGIMEKLQQWLAISNSIKTIVGKIDKL